MGKVVIVAKDQVAMAAIDYNTELPDQVIRVELTDSEFDYFFTSGLVQELNQVCDSMIDDFEDDSIVGYKKLNNALLVMEIYQYTNSRYSTFIGSLINLFQEALARNTAVYFYF